MQRRKFIGFGSAPLLGLVLSACGGGSDHDDGASEDWVAGEDVLIEAGVDPQSLASAPNPIAVPVELLQEVIDVPLRASVVLGTEPQVGVAVTFYDVAGNVIASAVTDAQGLATAAAPARRVVVAEARTADGRLLGMRFYGEHDAVATLCVDILQTVFVDVAVRLLGHYNVSLYVLQDYFRIPHDTNVFDIGHDNPSLDQTLAFAQWRQSGRSLEDYVQALVEDVVGHVDDDAHFNLDFNAIYQARLSGNALAAKSDERDVIETIGKDVIDLINNAIPVPFVSELLKLGFGRFLDGLFPKVDPFADIRASLGEIVSRLSRIEDLIRETNWDSVQVSVVEKISDYSIAIRLHKELSEAGAGPVNQHQLHLYEESLLALTGSPAIEQRLRNVFDFFVGLGEYERVPGINKFFSLLQGRVFYSRATQLKYRDGLNWFAALMIQCHLIQAISHILRGQKQGETAEYVGSRLQMTLESLDTMLKTLKNMDVESLPDRINIDHARSLAWIGSCGIVDRTIEFWQPTRATCYERERRWIGFGEAAQYVWFCTASGRGTGLDDWKGPVPRVQMGRSRAYVDAATLAFGEWRSASANEFKASFFDGAKMANKKVDVYAAMNDFSCFSTKWNIELKAFNNFLDGKPIGGYRDELAQVPTRFRRAGRAGGNGAHYYIDCDCFDLRRNSMSSRDVRNNYYQGQRYVFFPTCSVTEERLEQLVPWLRVEKLREAGKLLIRG